MITEAASLGAYQATREAWRTAIAAQQRSQGAGIVIYPKEGGPQLPLKE